ncbi:hypothetical protein JZU68_07610, partial [bacterium]|nr:hypothetical protein [bacterium]
QRTNQRNMARCTNTFVALVFSVRQYYSIAFVDVFRSCAKPVSRRDISVYQCYFNYRLANLQYSCVGR